MSDNSNQDREPLDSPVEPWKVEFLRALNDPVERERFEAALRDWYLPDAPENALPVLRTTAHGLTSTSMDDTGAAMEVDGAAQTEEAAQTEADTDLENFFPDWWVQLPLEPVGYS